MHRVELKDLNIVKGLPVSFLLVFLMHRVELKESNKRCGGILLASMPFLMHRVELKDIMSEKLEKDSLKFVPNAPCGVESLQTSITKGADPNVPNAPCGVERELQPPLLRGSCRLCLFLMHRVELKGPARTNTKPFSSLVPNAPCGVERYLACCFTRYFRR